MLLKSLVFPSKEGTVFSMSVFSDGNPYGVHSGLVFSFPCICKGHGKVEIVPGFTWDSFLKEKIALTEKELMEERSMIEHLLGGNMSDILFQITEQNLETGLRGYPCGYCTTSFVDAQKGLFM